MSAGETKRAGGAAAVHAEVVHPPGDEGREGAVRPGGVEGRPQARVRPEADPPALVPARMINAFFFCPRLAFLEWVEGDFRENVFTAQGKLLHRNLDRERGALAPAASSGGEDGPPLRAQSVLLSAPEAGIIARIDLVEGTGREAVPVDYKRGRARRLAEEEFDPAHVQLAAQAIVLRENGYDCREGIVYYDGSRRRVAVPITDALLDAARVAASRLRALAESGELPPPLEGSPKCGGCSLAPICLPDEVTILRRGGERGRPRQLVPACDDALPLHVQSAWGRVGRAGDCLKVKLEDGEAVEVPMGEVSQLCVYGDVQVSTQAARELAAREIPICFFTRGGWFYGMLTGLPHRNVLLRQRQYEAAADSERALGVARVLVRDKIANQRTMLRRNGREVPPQALTALRHLARKAAGAPSMEALLGIEGSAARVYFSHFALMFREGAGIGFDMAGRNRRPPTDPANAILSFLYGLLTRELTVTAAAVGFDPYLGLYHQPRYGRPSLALDLMEPFRPLIADSVAINLVNNRVLGERDFVRSGRAVGLKREARRKVIQAYERRAGELVTHPTFGYRIAYRRILEVQARLLARHLAGEIDRMPSFVTR